MTDHPILFQADMVRAIMTCSQCGTITLDIECPKCGSKKRRKFETRRIVKRLPMHADYGEPDWNKTWIDDSYDPPCLKVAYDGGAMGPTVQRHWHPYVPGDLLGVRETWWDLGWFEKGKWNGRCESHVVGVKYCATCPDPFDGEANHFLRRHHWRTEAKILQTYRKRPSIVMPKWACRNWLKVLAGGVERVQEISHVDIEAEGVTFDLITNLLKPTKTKQGHWISGGEYDASEDYCYDCAKKRVDELNGMDGDKDYVVDGGWESHDSDYIAHCEKCDCLLNYWPTHHLFETELDGFESCGEIIPLHNEDRYSFDTLCCAAPDQNEAIQNRTLKLCWQYLWDSVYAKPRPRYAKKEIIYYESYPWKAGTETREHRGKPWHIHGNPFLFKTTFERYEQ